MTAEQFTELLSHIDTGFCLIAGLVMSVVFAVTWKG